MGIKNLVYLPSKREEACLQSLKWEKNQAALLNKAAEDFRDHIWTIVEKWMLSLKIKEGENSWKRFPETQLVDNLPTLLRGISKVIEDPAHIVDFEPGGVIYEAASELGRNRRLRDFEPSEVLYEQEVLRDIIWGYCRKNLMPLDAYELEKRINRPVDKMVSTIINSYINIYAMELKHLARRDKLTDFLNYEAFKETLSDELRRSRRYRHSFSLIMLDIDGFQNYIKEFGNLAGDTLLKEVSRVVEHIIRTVDIPARHGLDEFAIILPETSKKQARRVAERMRRAIKLDTRHTAQVHDELKSGITVSIGVSTYPKDAGTLDELVSLTDEALFEAKKAGRDIVVWK